ncbi:MAG: hypothetical protein AAB706_00170 [Patescibacteria group bacterium]
MNWKNDLAFFFLQVCLSTWISIELYAVLPVTTDREMIVNVVFLVLVVVFAVFSASIGSIVEKSNRGSKSKFVGGSI